MGSTVSVGKVERTWRNSMTLIGHRLTTLHNIMIHHEFSVRGCAYQSMFIQFFITIIIQIQTNKYASSTIICGYPVQLYSTLHSSSSSSGSSRQKIPPKDYHHPYNWGLGRFRTRGLTATTEVWTWRSIKSRCEASYKVTISHLSYR